MNNLESQKKIGCIKNFRCIDVDDIKSHGSLRNIPNIPEQCNGIMAAMIFSRSKFLDIVPYDIKTYHGYHSEEQFFYSVRLWTHGYNCYTPSQHILAMEYETNKERINTEARKHLCKDSSLWKKLTWKKCKYYLKLDTLENVNYEDYINDVLLNQDKYGLGVTRSVIEYYKYVDIHYKLIELFPFYKKYFTLYGNENKSYNNMLEIHNPGQEIAIVTQNTKNIINEYFIETRKNHINYSNKHNYSYYVFYENLAEEVNKGESPKICWSKVRACLNIISNHKYIMWIDADAIFCNQDIKIEDKISIDITKDFFLSKDPKSHYINSGVMIWKNTEISKEILNKWWNMEHLSYGKGGDQMPLGKYLKTNVNYKKYWHHFEENDINCYPTNYNPNNYIIHYMGQKSKINIKERVFMWNNIIKYEKENPYIYISISVIPSRINSLILLIENLFGNTVKPNKIILTLPDKYNLFDSDDHINLIKNKLHHYIKKEKVYINEIIVDGKNNFDYGPSNKWIGMFDYAKKNLINQNYVFIVIDDDLLYYKNIIEDLIEEHKENPKSVISGYSNFSSRPSNIKISLNNLTENNKDIKIIKGGNGTLIPKYLFNIDINPSFKEIVLNGINDEIKDLIYMDDYIISAYINYKNINIKSIYDKILMRKLGKGYDYNNKIEDNKILFNGVSKNNINDNANYNNTHISSYIKNFHKYYNWDKYSNVKMRK